jgi:hypothetical protein
MLPQQLENNNVTGPYDVPVSLNRLLCRILTVISVVTFGERSTPRFARPYLKEKPSMFKRLEGSCASLLIVLSLSFVRAAGQSSVADVVGIPPDAAMYAIPGLGYVNLNSGNLHLEIPIRSVKERNGKTRTTSILYDSSVYRVNQTPCQNGQGCTYYWAVAPPQSQDEWFSSLTLVSDPSYSGTATFQNENDLCGTIQVFRNINWQFTDSHGTIHPFPTTLFTQQGGTVGCADTPSIQAAATDGSGYWLEVSNYTNATVYDMHGNVGNSSKDTNGNFAIFSSNGVGDDFGRSIFLPSSFTLNFKTINVWTNFGQPRTTELGPVSGTVLSSLVLPDGRSYSFQYDEAGTPAQPGHYGGLTGITLPTGGQITIAMEEHVATTCSMPYVVSHITTPDGTWNFSYCGTSASVTATAPLDLRTGLSSQTTITGGAGLTQTVSTYAGTATGTPLRKVVTQFRPFSTFKHHDYPGQQSEQQGHFYLRRHLHLPSFNQKGVRLHWKFDA